MCFRILIKAFHSQNLKVSSIQFLGALSEYHFHLNTTFLHFEVCLFCIVGMKNGSHQEKRKAENEI